MPTEQTSPQPKTTTLEEAQALIHEQSKQIERLLKQLDAQSKRIAELEEKLGTNSRNSSKPPSTESHKGSGKKKKGSNKKAGGQPGHQGKGRALFSEEQITHMHRRFPDKQCACGGEVKTTGLHWRHQTIDIPEVKPLVMEYQLYAGTCQGCGKQHKASLPAGVSTTLVGPRLLALIGTLTGGYRLSKRLVPGRLHEESDV